MAMKIRRRSSAIRVGIALVAGVLGAVGAGCEQGAEGDRCNPDLSHNECNSGLSCQQPVNCPENYCCPTSGPSSNPFCQPGCSGGLESICAADPTYDACVTDAEADTAPEAATTDGGVPDAGTDTGTTDTGTLDTGTKDSGPRDASHG
jgi:hypothetical protein